MPEKRMMHGAVVLGGYLYVIGGNRYPEGYTNAVHFAPIGPDSQLGAWRETTPMPQRRAYIANSTLAIDDVLYVVGGLDVQADNRFASVLWTRPLPDGNLEPWRESASFAPMGLSNLTCVSTPGFLHILGGNAGTGRITNAVVSGVLSPQGGVVAWEQGVPLPKPTWFHNAAAVGGRVWVWGGLNSSDRASRTPEVFSAPILANGRLGRWRLEAESLPEGIYSGAGTSVGNYLLTFFPRTRPEAWTPDIYFSQVSEGGVLSPWGKLAAEIPNKLYLAAAPDYRRGTIYIPAGRITFEDTPSAISNQVFFFPLASAGGDADPARTDSVRNLPGGAEQTPAAYSFQARSNASPLAGRGFLDLDKAREAMTRGPRRPLFLYFHSPDSQPCVQQVALLESTEFARLSDRAVFAWIDIRDWPQLVQQLGVFRAPTWILYTTAGEQMGNNFAGVLTPAQIAAAIEAAR